MSVYTRLNSQGEVASVHLIRWIFGPEQVGGPIKTSVFLKEGADVLLVMSFLQQTQTTQTGSSKQRLGSFPEC